MKKFFILICGILLATNAFSYTRKEPSTVPTDLWTAWGYQGDDYLDNFTTDLSGEFMSAYRIGEPNQSGACGINDEGAGVAIIATDIFSNGHGAKFCARQIQANNEYGGSSIDFYDTKDYNKYCFTFCKYGYYGNQCNQTEFSKCDDNDYTSEFPNVMDVPKWLDKTDKYCHDPSKIKTEITPVFYKNLNNQEANLYFFSRVVLLGVTAVKKHGIIVGPVDIRVQTTSRNSSWISYVKGNGKQFALCAAGYKPNEDNSDCVAVYSSCDDMENLNNLCSGFSKDNYKSDEHSLVYNNSRKCYNVRCQNHKGFSSEYNTTCVECPGAPLAYVNDDGICDMCERGTNPNEKCKGNMKSYDKLQMQTYGNRQCWLETNAKKFLGCVKGCGANQCWKNNACTNNCD